MQWTWAVLPLVLAGSQLGIHAQEARNISEGLVLRRKVRETETNCSERLYQVGQFCCQPCQPGERKSSDCTVNGGKPKCLNCTEGKEYMDREHYSEKCRRCTHCDEGHGLEVEANCTKTQNTKCKCKPDFYCTASVCEHCDPCSKCEHGILENCTLTSNTKCKQKSSGSHSLWWLFSLVFLVPIVFIGIYKKCWRRHHDDPESGISRPETMPIIVPDINLSEYISSIAEQMELHQVRNFVRKNGIPETKIDEIKNDNIQNTAEQKIKLLQCWYQSHGKKGAYDTLITGLKKINCCALAERIQAMVQADMEGSPSDNRNENE